MKDEKKDEKDEEMPAAPTEEAPSPSALSDDEMVLVDEPTLDPFPPMTTMTTPSAAAGGKGKAAVDVTDKAPPSGVRATLIEMGFTNESLLSTVLMKHGDDVEACARDLAAATEWEGLLESLSEMGFTNRELNQTLMLKHSGNMKRTVKDLIDAEDV